MSGTVLSNMGGRGPSSPPSCHVTCRSSQTTLPLWAVLVKIGEIQRTWWMILLGGAD